MTDDFFVKTSCLARDDGGPCVPLDSSAAVRKRVAEHLEKLVSIANNDELDIDVRIDARWSIMMLVFLFDKTSSLYPGDMSHEIKQAVCDINGGVAMSVLFEEVH